MNTGYGFESAREANRENIEERGRQLAGTGAVVGMSRARQWHGTAPALAFRAKKSQPIGAGVFGKWWLNSEPNPRPLPKQESKVSGLGVLF